MSRRNRNRIRSSRQIVPVNANGAPPTTVSRFGGGGLEGAEYTSQETLLWNASRLSPDQIINGLNGNFGAKIEADARSRDVVTNDGFGQGIVDQNRDSIVGTQFRLNAMPAWEVLQATVSKSFDEDWANEFKMAVEQRFNLIGDSNACWLDAARTLTFTGLVRMAIAGFIYTGEVLATGEWIRDPRRPFSTAVQMISPMRLSNQWNRIDTKNLRNGVFKDDNGKPLSYFIRDAYPTEFYQNIRAFYWTEVPAEKPWGRRMVIHIKDAIQPAQTRGISQLVAVLKQMRMTKKFQDVTLQNAVINASYAATIESDLPSDVIAAAMGSTEHRDAGEGYMAFLGTWLRGLNSYLEKANGVAIDGAKMPHLFPGTKLNTKTLGTPGGVGTDFEASLLRHTAAGLGISYEEFANDFSRSNYSSARASMLMTDKHMKARKKFVADRFADEVFALWLEEDLNAGNLPMPRNYDHNVFYDPFGKEALTACDWIGSGRGQIDELKETQAAVIRIAAGLSTRETEIAKSGGDWRKIFHQLSREAKLAETLDLEFSTTMEQSNVITAQLTPEDGESPGSTPPVPPKKKATIEKTVVTSWTDDGRIKSFEKHIVSA